MLKWEQQRWENGDWLTCLLTAFMLLSTVHPETVKMCLGVSGCFFFHTLMRTPELIFYKDLMQSALKPSAKDTADLTCFFYYALSGSLSNLFCSDITPLT